MGNAERSRAEVGQRPKYQPLVLLLSMLACGAAIDRVVAIDRLVEGAYLAWMALGFLTLTLAMLGWNTCVSLSATTGMLMLSACAIGGAWHHARWSHYGANELAWYATEVGQPVLVEAVVVDSPRWLPAPDADPMSSRSPQDRTRIGLRVQRVRNGTAWVPAEGLTTLTCVGNASAPKMGDRVRIVGMLRKPSCTRNPGEFDFAVYLRQRRELCSLYASAPACITILDRGMAWTPARLLAQVRRQGERQLVRFIHSGRARLAVAILLGSREQLNDDATDLFFFSGTIHLLAISGLHLAILAGCISLVGRLCQLPERWNLLVVCTFVIVYALLTDSRPPILRAAVLVIVICLARVVRRRAIGFNTLAAAGIVVFALHPGHLFQVGTQLSFLAVATLIFLAPWLRRRVPEDPLDRLIANTRPLHRRMFASARWTLWQTIVASTAVWLTTLPLVMHHFHLAAPAGLLLNPILWVPVSIVLVSGFAILVLGWIAPPIAAMCGLLCDTSLAAIDACLRGSCVLPIHHFWTCGPSAWWLLCHYVALGALAACPRCVPRYPIGCALLCLWITVGYLTSPVAFHQRRRATRQELSVTFLAVGHGTCVLIECPDGANVMYDAGSLSSPSLASRTVASALWSRGVLRVDAIILSHADIDHFNACPALLKRFDVRNVVVSPHMFTGQSPALEVLAHDVSERGIPIHVIGAGSALRVSADVRVEVLLPPMNGIGGNDNANSIVLLLEHRGRRILLPGDLEGLGMSTLLQMDPLDCDVVMAPHHGSSNSNPLAFAQWSTPEWIAISSGRSIGTDHDDDPRIRRLNTHRDGAIRFTVDAAGMITCRHWNGATWEHVTNAD